MKIIQIAVGNSTLYVLSDTGLIWKKDNAFIATTPWTRVDGPVESTSELAQTRFSDILQAVRGQE